MAAELTALVFALGREVMYLRRELRPLERLHGAPCAAWRSPRGVLLITGMGAEAAGRATAWLLGGGAGGRPARVLSAGLCGGLVPEWPVGAALWPDRVVSEDGISLPLEAPAGAPTTALLSVNAPIADAARRQHLAARYAAGAVDMETAAVARLCHDAGVAVSGLRVVSDDVRRPLSAALAVALAGERVRPARLLAALLARPWLAAELCRLARDTRAAARRLAAEAISWLERADRPLR